MSSVIGQSNQISFFYIHILTLLIESI